MSFATRTPCLSCSGYAKPGTRDTMGYLLLRFPVSFSMGIYNCRPVAGSSTLSKHACGRAGDSGIPTLVGGAPNHAEGDPLVRFLIEHSSFLGLEEVIWARIIYDRVSPGGRVYTGVHPHNDHGHWAQTPTASSTLTYAALVAELGDPQPTQEDSMKQGDTGNDVKFFQKALNAWPATDPKLTVDGVFGPSMEAAVVKYQKAADIEANGEIGTVTAVLLAEWVPDKAAAPAPPGGVTIEEGDARWSKKGHTHAEGTTAPDK